MPIKKIRIKNRFSPWFNRDLVELLHLKNSIWQIAQHKHTQADWLSFRQIRNKSTQAIRKDKVSYFKEQFSLCGSNPKKFWKMVKDLGNKPSCSQLPMSLNVDDVVVTDKKHMAELFNHHFMYVRIPIKSGFHAPLPVQHFVMSNPFLPFVLLSVPNNVSTMFCSAAMLCCYHVVVMLCCYHAVLSCVAALLCCFLRSLFM